jgi:hypothetical protein
MIKLFYTNIFPVHTVLFLIFYFLSQVCWSTPYSNQIVFENVPFVINVPKTPKKMSLLIFIPGSLRTAKNYIWLEDETYASAILDIDPLSGFLHKLNFSKVISSMLHHPLFFNKINHIVLAGHSFGSAYVLKYRSHLDNLSAILIFGFVPSPEEELLYTGSVPILITHGTNDCETSVIDSIAHILFYSKSKNNKIIMINKANHANWAKCDSRNNINKYSIASWCDSMHENEQRLIASYIVQDLLNGILQFNYSWDILDKYQSDTLEKCDCCNTTYDSHNWQDFYCEEFRNLT